MKALLKISLITLALASPAFAGPSDGSGTNINLEKNDLTDNVKFHADFGDTQKQISSRKFKLAKDKNSIYDDVKPLIDRAESLYPGMGVMMEKAFDKTWLLVNTDYAGRNANEKKVISQTDAAIYVSLPWLKKAQPKQVREAFLHETVRRFSHDLVEQLTYNEKAKVDHTALDDEITESLTPVLFNRLPASILKERMDNATILIRNFSIDQNIISGNPKRHPRIASRAEIYADLSAVGGAKGIRKICGAVESSILFSSQSAVNETWDFLKSLSPEQRESLNKYRADFNKEPVMSLDPGAEDAMNLLTKPLPRSNYGFVDGAKVCGAKKYERFLSEYEKSGEKAQAREEGITELPSDEDATEAPAK